MIFHQNPKISIIVVVYNMQREAPRTLLSLSPSYQGVPEKEYEVIIVGSGIGGCGAAALLAKDFGKKVLVLEKSPYIGGRVASYTGKGDKVTIDGRELDYRGFMKSLADTRCWVSYCEPDIKTMFSKGLLDGWTFENGGHGLFWGNKSRCHLLLEHLGLIGLFPGEV